MRDSRGVMLENLGAIGLPFSEPARVAEIVVRSLVASLGDKAGAYIAQSLVNVQISRNLVSKVETVTPGVLGELDAAVRQGSGELIVGNYVDGVIVSWMIVPLRMLLIPGAAKRYKMYHIGLALSSEQIPEKLRAQLKTGYYGVTKRGVSERWVEHYNLADANRGFALHTAWNAANTTFRHCNSGMLTFTVAGTADTLPEIYAMEEAAVRNTLLPSGLNVIPGGYAGIALLNTLRITRNSRLSPEQRDALIAELESTERAGPCAHYRRGHVRRLPNHDTWVSGCFVGLAPLPSKVAA